MAHYSDKEHLFPMHGGCPCGTTRYQLTLPPLIVHCCHCTACKREVASAFAINAIVETSGIKLLPSETAFIPASRADPSPQPCGVIPGYANLTNSSPVSAPEKKGVTKPDLITIPSPSGIGVTLAQCPKCHTVLWNHYADAGPLTAYLRVGTLDTPCEIDPDVHIFTASRRNFGVIDDGKPQFEQYYQSREEMCREEVLPRLRAIQGSGEMAKFKAEQRRVRGLPPL